jgi:HEAT repeat protein
MRLFSTRREKIQLIQFKIDKLTKKRDIKGLRKLLKNKDARDYAATALLRLLDHQTLEYLIAALKDPQVELRIYAVRALGAIINPNLRLRLLLGRAVDPLIEALKDPDFNVRSSAANALGNIGVESAVEPLLASLKDPSPLVGGWAAFALGEIGDKRAVEPLIEALKDPVMGIGKAASALGKIGDKRAVEPLIEALKSPDDFLRSLAAFALGEIGDKRAVEPLIEALKDPYSGVRRGAEDSLLKFNQIEVERVRKSIFIRQMKVGELHISLITHSLLQPSGSLNKKVSARLASKGLAVSDRNMVHELEIDDVLELVKVSRDVAKQYIDALKMMV